MDAHRKAIIHGSGQSAWRTPTALVIRLKATFHVTVDLAANRQSTICDDRFLGPGSVIAEDALAVCWADLFPDSVGFLNPPYSLSERKALKLAGKFGWELRHLEIARWAEKAYVESQQGFTTIGVFPYAPQTEWFRAYVMGHAIDVAGCSVGWRGHAALDCWRIPHRVSFLQPDGSPSNNAGVNTCIIHWGPNPGWVGPWVPSMRYWTYR